MKCKKPLIAYWHIGHFTEKGKKLIEWKLPRVNSNEYEQVEIPCGHCIACRLNKSRDWAVRCVCEARDHDENYFITLTYDNEHLKDTRGNVGINNLEWFPTVSMDEVTSFVKRLRADQEYRSQSDPAFPDNGMKFLAATEYGELEARPHAHLALFGVHVPKTLENGISGMRYWKTTDQGFVLYESEYFKRLWRNGRVIVGDVSAWSAQYIAKYSVKNTTELHEWCEKLHVEKPRLRMSRNPGIGMNYFKRNCVRLLNDGTMWIDGKEYILPDTWLSVGENNEECMYDAISDAIDSLDKKLAEYENRYDQTDKTRESELNEFSRRPKPEIYRKRKGV